MTRSITSAVVEEEGWFTLRSPEGISYRVDLGERILAPENPLLANYIGGRRLCAFVSPTVDRLYGRQLREYLGAHLEPGDWTMTEVPSGEANKTLANVERTCAFAKRFGLDRHGVMMAFGGGVVSDVVGFAASIYARGVSYVKINTTLVAQVDAGVGVKTGVNGVGAKNMLGAYHAPDASLNDMSFLATLPLRETRCGLAEIVKMAVIRDEELFRVIDENAHALQHPMSDRGGEVGRRVSRTAIRLMLDELCDNLCETDLARIVDFGHTFGPVIETASGYRVAHGESVAIDMAISSHIARVIGVCPAGECERIVDLIARLGLPVFDPQTCTPEFMRRALTAAWERRGRRLNLVLPSALGKTVFVESLEDLPLPVLEEALAALRGRSGAAGAPGVSPSVPGPATGAVSSGRPEPRRGNVYDDLMRAVYGDHGGDGPIRVHRAYDRLAGLAPVAFIDLVTIPPASSIGRHRHGDDQETYIVLRGQGMMSVDGEEFPVRAGDVIVNGPFGEHGLRNDSTVPLELLVFEAAGEDRAAHDG
ncbi:MAG TPA: cupin domain-containing protein [Rugosimonospora sp.]|nr:cupin domain-containing protein [Rugosimonospora sp.]